MHESIQKKKKKKTYDGIIRKLNHITLKIVAIVMELYYEAMN